MIDATIVDAIVEYRGFFDFQSVRHPVAVVLLQAAPTIPE